MGKIKSLRTNVHWTKPDCRWSCPDVLGIVPLAGDLWIAGMMKITGTIAMSDVIALSDVPAGLRQEASDPSR
ncbi:hypothetical protein [Sinorhizobium sp. BG8]|uniref:hypothetical protein n=1 Tax=Sinorhizobium sp. BG8 TaxID=2613773 RepID=UPI00193E8232|nr:hypothetical protein [Sinorhizobium sp. BG8]QRM55580.1 hypothetical protein F3Y30_14400 [Sinorhizobium sp. BG8]